MPRWPRFLWIFLQISGPNSAESPTVRGEANGGLWLVGARAGRAAVGSAQKAAGPSRRPGDWPAALKWRLSRRKIQKTWENRGFATSKWRREMAAVSDGWVAYLLGLHEFRLASGRQPAPGAPGVQRPGAPAAEPLKQANRSQVGQWPPLGTAPPISSPGGRAQSGARGEDDPHLVVWLKMVYCSLPSLLRRSM